MAGIRLFGYLRYSKKEGEKKTFTNRYHENRVINVALFTWGKLERGEKIRSTF